MASPLVEKISFTGAVSTGKKIMESAGATLKRVHLELGGKLAQIVLDDWELDTAAAGDPLRRRGGRHPHRQRLELRSVRRGS